MTPALTESLPIVVPRSSHPLSLFPDGIKTSGQHPPLYDELLSFDSFPTEIAGPTVWRSDDYVHNPERWIHDFTHEEISEMSAAADGFITAKLPLTGISKVLHTVPALSYRGSCGFRIISSFPIYQGYWNRYDMNCSMAKGSSCSKGSQLKSGAIINLQWRTWG